MTGFVLWHDDFDLVDADVPLKCRLTPLALDSVSQVFGCLQKRGLAVTVLSDASIAEYKASDYLHGSDVPFLRALKTSAYKDVVNCPFLEQPNIVTGLPAAGNFAQACL